MEFRANNSRGIDDKLVFSRQEVEKLHYVKHYIDSNLDAKLTIPLLSKQFHIGTTHLKQGFRQYFGSTVYQYILRQRMETAKQLLASGQRVRQVAADTGYSLTGFSKVFKNYTGISPVAYRNSLR